MKPEIWIADLDVENYRSFRQLGWADEEFLKKWEYFVDRFREGGSLLEEWEEIEMELFPGEPGRKRKEQRLPIPDFSNGRVVDACSDRARQVIEPLVAGQVEFLPLKTPVGRYWEMNLQRLSCLDEERSEVIYLYPEEKKKIFKVLRYAFHWERLEGQHIFWIDQVGKRPTFVSDEFKRLVEKNGLTGLLFYPVPLVEDSE